MEKPRFLVCKREERRSMATAALAIPGMGQHTPANRAQAAGGFSGSRNLVEGGLSPDQSVVARCLSGDETAWEELVRIHTRQVYGLCFRFTGSGSEAQDLTQEVFLRVFKTIKSFR